MVKKYCTSKNIIPPELKTENDFEWNVLISDMDYLILKQRFIELGFVETYENIYEYILYRNTLYSLTIKYCKKYLEIKYSKKLNIYFEMPNNQYNENNFNTIFENILYYEAFEEILNFIINYKQKYKS